MRRPGQGTTDGGFVHMLLWIFLSMLAPFCTANGKEVEPTFRISHFHHPEMEAFKALMRGTYQRLNTSVTFHELPAARGVVQLNNGFYDADVVRLSTSLEGFDNVLKIEPALVDAEILLLCLMNTPCEQTVLNDEHLLIASNLGNQHALSDIPIKAKVLHDETNTHSLDMLRLGRVDYVIYGSNRHFREQLATEFLVVVLKEQRMYHIINKKHASLKPQIEAALAQELLSFDEGLRR